MAGRARSIWVLASGCSREAWLRYGADRLHALSPQLEAADVQSDDGPALLAHVVSDRDPSPLSHRQLRYFVKAPPTSAAAAPRVVGDGFAMEAIEHTADEGFRVIARSRPDLLAAAAEALAALMVEPSAIELREERWIHRTIDEADVPDDERLFGWLAEVLYVMDALRFAIRRVVVVSDDARGVRGLVCGEPLDEQRHGVRGAIKAITYHGMEIERRDDGEWHASVIVDV